MSENEHKTSRRQNDKVQSKLVENRKTRLITSTGSTCADLKQFSLDYFEIMQRCARKLPKPIENPINGNEELEMYMNRTDSSLFLHTSHTKKRPNNVVFGRSFDGIIYQEYEFELENYLGLSDIKSNKPSLISAPVLLFAGDRFENDINMSNCKSLLLDAFGSNKQFAALSKDAIQWVMLFTAVNDTTIKVRSYILNDETDNGLKKCLEPTHLSEMGFNFNLILRRNYFDVKTFQNAMKEANVDGKGNEIGQEEKNITTDELGRKMATLHVEAGDYDRLNLRKYKGEFEDGEEVEEEDLLEFEEEEQE